MYKKLAALAVCLGGTMLFGQDVMSVAPAGVAKVEVDNDQVRIIRFTEATGTKIPMHSHPAYVDIPFTNDVGTYTFPTGKPKTMKTTAGHVTFSPGVTHAGNNIGSGTSEGIMIELKTKPVGSVVNVATDQAKVAKKMTKVVLNNEYVRVMKVTIKPGGKLPLHSHPNFVVIYPDAGKARVTLQDGKSQDMDIPARSVRYNNAVSHSNENIGTTTVIAYVVELKTAAK
jgi:quercetin dioxygenase-like cupin family protein